MNLSAVLTLEPHGPDTFVGTGPTYPWGGLYGGQIVAQGLRAAALTVAPEFGVHSVHAYFIRRGDASEPIRCEVDRLRNGRSFCTRRVVVRQAVGAILSLDCSFQRPEPAPDVSGVTIPPVAGPDGLADSGWSSTVARRFTPWAGEPGRRAAWLRTAEDLGDDPTLQACALAYLSDELPTDAVVDLHPDGSHPDRLHPDRLHPDGAATGEEDHEFIAFSLDHAIWFHRPFRVDAWHLHAFTCDVLLHSRGLSRGHVFTAEGTHVATVTQEVLLRPRRR